MSSAISNTPDFRPPVAYTELSSVKVTASASKSTTAVSGVAVYEIEDQVYNPATKQFDPGYKMDTYLRNSSLIKGRSGGRTQVVLKNDETGGAVWANAQYIGNRMDNPLPMPKNASAAFKRGYEAQMKEWRNPISGTKLMEAMGILNSIVSGVDIGQPSGNGPKTSLPRRGK
jgi:hypothetical protein